MWVMIDNYDSFSYILLDYLLQFESHILVVKNDEISLNQLIALNPKRLIISPGPKTPNDSLLSKQAFEYYVDKIPILGICLGHQLMGEYFGATLTHATYPMHGKVDLIYHNQKEIFSQIDSPTQVMRYHSLIITDINEKILEIIAITDSGICMGIKHKELPIIGLQFHPESICTPMGLQMIENWVNLY